MSDHFCMSPFVRMTQWWNGNLNTCTHYREMTGDGTKCEKQVFIPSGKYGSLKEAFRGVEMHELRQAMLKGDKLDGCHYCYHLESMGLMSLRESINATYSNPPARRDLPQLLEAEIYPSNKCNFSCTICNSDASSVWGTLPLQSPKPVPEKTYLMEGMEDLELLTISGGEPFLMPEYDRDFFKGRKAKMFTMATNNSVFPKPEFFQFLERCDNCLVYLSLDGVGDVGEFCRRGLSMKRFEKNMEKWKEWFDQSKFERNGNPDYKLRPPFLTGLRVMFVMQMFNFFNVYETLEWAEKNDIILDLRNCYSPEHLNVAYLPGRIKDDIIDNMEFYNETHKEFVIKVFESGVYDGERMDEFKSYLKYWEAIADIPDQAKEMYVRL